MSSKYIITKNYTSVKEEKGIIYNKSIYPIEISTDTKLEGIILQPKNLFQFNGKIYLRISNEYHMPSDDSKASIILQDITSSDVSEDAVVKVIDENMAEEESITELFK